VAGRRRFVTGITDWPLEQLRQRLDPTGPAATGSGTGLAVRRTGAATATNGNGSAIGIPARDGRSTPRSSPRRREPDRAMFDRALHIAGCSAAEAIGANGDRQIQLFA